MRHEFAVLPTGTGRRKSLSLDLMGSQISLSGLSQFLHDSTSIADVKSSPGDASCAATPPATDVAEKRQDNDCFVDHHYENDRGLIMSPRSSPIAALKLRRTRLFPDKEDGDSNKPKKAFTVKYSPAHEREELSSRSLASSMILVSPLRPLGNRHRAPSAGTRGEYANDFKAALIDSSKAVLRPLTPRQPKRSMSDMHLPVEETSETDYDAEFRAFPPYSRTLNFTQRKQQQQQQQTKVEAEQETNHPPAKPRWLIPAEHPSKVLWDVTTFLLSFANVYVTHTFIRDRKIGNSWFTTFCEAWFMIDILLNFITEYRSDNYALRDCRSVWARYLTTWFVVDLISLFPGEQVYVKPLFEIQNRRNFFQKNFFRSRAVVRVTRILRGRHLKMFGQAAKHTKHAGVGASRLLRLLIKYIPKYLLFFRNMKGVLAIRTLRQVHWFRKVWRNYIFKGLENETKRQTAKSPWSLRKNRPVYDKDEDGAPF